MTEKMQYLIRIRNKSIEHGVINPTREIDAQMSMVCAIPSDVSHLDQLSRAS